MSYAFGIETEAKVLEAEVTTILSQKLSDLIEEEGIDFYRDSDSFGETVKLRDGDFLTYSVSVMEEGKVRVRVNRNNDLTSLSSKVIELGLEGERLNTYKGKKIVVDSIRNYIENWEF